MTKPRNPKESRRSLTPSQRRDELRLLLCSGWHSQASIMERLEISRTTAWRCIQEIAQTDPLEELEEGGRTLYRLPASARRHPLYITTAEMMTLAFVRNSLSYLAGTGIKGYLDGLIDRLVHVLKAEDFALWKNLDAKFFDVNEAAHAYDKIDVVDEVITALLREHRCVLTLKNGEQVKVDPYTLVLYKKGLYLLSLSHKRGELRTFGLDKVEDVTRLTEEPVVYPPGFSAAAHFRGPFGMIRGPRERVVIHFDASVAYFVTRKNWHETQGFRTLESGALEMTAECEGWEEAVSWVLSFGEKAEAIEPKGLRDRVANALRAASKRYE